MITNYRSRLSRRKKKLSNLLPNCLFKEQCQRHSNVPQTGRAQGHVPASHHPQRVVIPGKQVSVRLNKSQIDKASKDKSGKFSENFNVTLFLLRPNDQMLKEDYSLVQMAESWPSGDRATQSSDDSSDDSSQST